MNLALPKSISNLVTRLLGGLVPARRRSGIDPLFQHAPIAHTLTADRLHHILRSAENGDTTELFGLYEEIVTFDAHIQGEFGKRKLALLGQQENLTPFDPEDPDDVAACEACKALVDHRDWLEAMKVLTDACMFPVAVLEKVWQPSMQPGLRYELASLKKVDYRLLDYTMCRKLRIENVTADGMPAGTYHEADSWSYVVHRGHLLTTPDHWGGPMRALLFWWLFATMDRDWWVRFLERFGTPFLVGKFEQSDDESRAILLRAFSSASRLFGLVISKETEVEVQQVSDTNTGEAFKVFHTYAQEQISKLIVGQTMSADSKPTALGDGASGLHGEVRDDFRVWDARVTGNTVRLQVFADFLTINGLPGRPPKITWGGEEKEDATATATVIKTMHDAGLELTPEAITLVSERLGLEFAKAPPPPAPMLPPGLGRGPLLDKKPDAAFSAGHDHPDPLDSIARSGSADLARAFRATLAPVARIIHESKSAAECEAKLAAFTASWRPGEAAQLMENALVAFAANATAEARTPAGA